MLRSTYQTVLDTFVKAVEGVTAVADFVTQVTVHPEIPQRAEALIEETRESIQDSLYERDPQQAKFTKAKTALTTLSQEVFALQMKIKQNHCATAEDFEQIKNIKRHKFPAAGRLIMEAMAVSQSEKTRLQSNMPEHMNEEYALLLKQIDTLFLMAHGLQSEQHPNVHQSSRTMNYGTF